MSTTTSNADTNTNQTSDWRRKPASTATPMASASWSGITESPANRTSDGEATAPRTSPASDQEVPTSQKSQWILRQGAGPEGRQGGSSIHCQASCKLCRETSMLALVARTSPLVYTSDHRKATESPYHLASSVGCSEL